MTPRPKALITGASGGIGAALALAFAERGYDLVLLARRSDRLEEVAAGTARFGASAETLVTDLSTPDGLAGAAERAAAGDLDLLISNAGAAGYAPLREVSAADVDALWRLNSTAPVTLSHAVLPSLLAKGEGAIVTIASLLAFSSGMTAAQLPARTLYAAAKSATVAFTRTLATELVGTGVQAMVVCPGQVATEWSGGANRNRPDAMSAEDVATATAVALARGETVCAPGLSGTEALDRLQEAERALLAAGSRSSLADRYADASQ
ncbi:SDR family NAD(P)-dependent oxidoreductase [Kribbella sp. NBC_00382]|uniref:SDR family NAD(P)-dependent oxidoreductase n=1 Tax=Kribbella sp. NBC_00382 TaxID=2975967 RepID=UPI002E1A9942